MDKRRTNTLRSLFAWALLTLVAAMCAGPATARAQTYVDNMGREVRLDTPPQRIIALIPSLTEIVFALGLGERMVGATQWADHPQEARSLPRVGDYQTPSMESILSLAPDLVLVEGGGNPPWVVEQLEVANIPVFVTWIRDPRQVPEIIELLGAVCGVPERGRDLAREIQAKFDRVERMVHGIRPVRTLFIIGNRPVVSVGKDTFPDRLLTMAGAENLAADASGSWPRLSFDTILQSRPEAIIVSTMERGAERESLEQFWRNQPGIGTLQGLRIHSVQSDLVDRPGPRLGQGLTLLAEILHPGLFPDTRENRGP